MGPVRLGVMGLGEALWKFDANVIDGGVNGAGWMTRMSGTISSWWDKWIIDGCSSTVRRLWRGFVLSGAPAGVGPGAVVRAGHGDRRGRVSFGIT